VYFPTVEDICDINKEWIDKYGGFYDENNHNFSNTTPLGYVLYIIQYPVYGVDKYPSLIDKAAALAWEIIRGHIFNDGNKRTGMQAAIELLEMNGATTLFDSDSIVTIALEVASNSITIEELSSRISAFVVLPSHTLLI